MAILMKTTDSVMAYSDLSSNGSAEHAWLPGGTTVQAMKLAAEDATFVECYAMFPAGWVKCYVARDQVKPVMKVRGNSYGLVERSANHWRGVVHANYTQTRVYHGKSIEEVREALVNDLILLNAGTMIEDVFSLKDGGIARIDYDTPADVADIEIEWHKHPHHYITRAFFRDERKPISVRSTAAMPTGAQMFLERTLRRNKITFYSAFVNETKAF